MLPKTKAAGFRGSKLSVHNTGGTLLSDIRL